MARMLFLISRESNRLLAADEHVHPVRRVLAKEVGKLCRTQR